MQTNRELFYRHLALTSDAPLAIEIEYARGVRLFTPQGKSYIDFISGISVSNLGHAHPEIVQAVANQAGKYMHTMVYGELIQSPQVKLAEKICNLLPERLDSVYFVTSGSEAVEGAMKLAKRYTGRNEIVSFRNAYHGSSQGALSIMGEESWKNPFRPLLPSLRLLDFNQTEQLNQITDNTACVFIEPVQGEAGVMEANPEFLSALRLVCNRTGTMLVFDEIQTGMGRTGSMFAFEQYGISPDILLLAKAFGGGMPLGAFISSNEIMASLANNPPLGHITTFGGHPVCCAAGLASLEIISREKLHDLALGKGEWIRNKLKHKNIAEVRGKGLLLAMDLGDEKKTRRLIELALEHGLLTDWFLFNPHSVRLAPPLIISEVEMEEAVTILLRCLDLL